MSKSPRVNFRICVTRETVYLICTDEKIYPKREKAQDKILLALTATTAFEPLVSMEVMVLL